MFDSQDVFDQAKRQQGEERAQDLAHIGEGKHEIIEGEKVNLGDLDLDLFSLIIADEEFQG